MRTQFAGYLANAILPKIVFLHVRKLNGERVKLKMHGTREKDR
jgi:hypothetical protein